MAQSSLRYGYNNAPTEDAIELEWTGNARKDTQVVGICLHRYWYTKYTVVPAIEVLTISQSRHDQQLLRWGWEPLPPPRLTYQEYEGDSAFWVGNSVPRLGRGTKFADG